MRNRFFEETPTPQSVLSDGYAPSEDEPFMNPNQKKYFRNKLLRWREELMHNSLETFHHLQETSAASGPDFADKASVEEELLSELRARDRERKLIVKIEEALHRIDDGSYGYCEETGEQISLRRLEARPVATLSIEAQERRERYERVYRA